VKTQTTRLQRRDVLHRFLFGAGAWGLRSLATGLPGAFLLRPDSAQAQALCIQPSAAQYLVFATSDAGDPMNANVPGTYEHAGIAHPLDPIMAKTSFKLGSATVQAALPWSTLSQPVLDRTCFFHHTTLANNHPQQPKVMRLMGATNRQEMLVSIYARELARCLGTVQSEPVSVGASGVGELLEYQGRTLPRITPTGLRDALLSPTGPLTNLQKLRDQDLNRLNALFKQNGTPAQRAFLDRLAQSQNEARNISQELLENLSSITADDENNQMIAAAALVKMKVTPVVSVHLNFGGDNHSDANLQNEATRTTSAVAAINTLMDRLQTLGVSDQTSFAAMNVFGRTLAKKGTTGRDHWSNHHCSILIGSQFKGGVIGGLRPYNGDYGAMPINSQTGRADLAGDVPFGDTLGALGKTLGAALGVSEGTLTENISTGRIVRGALKT